MKENYNIKEESTLGKQSATYIINRIINRSLVDQ